MSLQAKEADLLKIIKAYGSMAVAFSGGTDSTLLAAAGAKALPENKLLLVHVSSPFLPVSENRFAEEWAAQNRMPLKVLHLNPLASEDIRKNCERRCYFCKKLIMSEVLKEAAAHGIEFVADGTNRSDFSDYRPGMKAADELGIKHPFVEASFDKDEIRALSKKYDLPNWNSPASACLASRIPYHTAIEVEALKKVDAAEDFLRELGFKGCRVRYYQQKAKIEVSPEDIAEIVLSRELILHELKKQGFKEVLLDLEGYRCGAMNQDIVK